MSIKPLILGLSGATISKDEREFFLVTPVYGFILFKRNIDSAPQLQVLVADLRNLYPNRQIYIFIDQEGGRVARLKYPLISKDYPAGEYFSKIYDQQGSIAAYEAVKDNYYQLTKDIKFYDIDSPCAPVADLTYSYTDGAIGDRSLGSSTEKVIQLCLGAAEGITAGGGLAIIKHIPGHGRATCDSHFELPRIKTSLAELETTDFAVFRGLAKHENIRFAMTAHIILDALDSNLPVTISAKAIKYIREKIGFNGLLITDDLSMLALHGRVGKDYHLIKKAITLTKQGSFADAKDQLRKIEDLGDKTLALLNDQLGDYLDKLLQILRKKYLESLKNVASQSIKASCDLVLHCSGDLGEMKIIANAVDDVNLEASMNQINL